VCHIFIRIYLIINFWMIHVLFSLNYVHLAKYTRCFKVSSKHAYTDIIFDIWPLIVTWHWAGDLAFNSTRWLFVASYFNSFSFSFLAESTNTCLWQYNPYNDKCIWWTKSYNLESWNVYIFELWPLNINLTFGLNSYKPCFNNQYLKLHLICSAIINGYIKHLSTIIFVSY